MTHNKNKFYVTTPLYYVNAKPHLGTLYSTLLADAAARWHKLQAEDTFFLTGTDEHGQKIAEAAAKIGKEPKEFVDSFIDSFKDIWHAFNIDYTYFIRTTDAHHVKAVQDWLQKLIAQDDIYKSFYTGWYCTHCETFLTDKDAENTQNGIPLCPTCSRPTHQVSEESYFFRLSAYQDRLLTFYREHPEFITPKERLQEVISFVESGLKDLSISRTTITWGIPFPGDSKHVTYVWADALMNYVTAIGYGDAHKAAEFAYWWPADVQVMGKDIVRFHAVYWPAFLMATDLEIPHTLLVHGWIKVGEQKMSKSLGNAVDPQELLKKYGADPVRYYLIRHMAITQDSPFSIEDLEQRINSDLANDLGNLLNRMLTLAYKFDYTTVEAPPAWGSAELALRDELWNMLTLVKHEMDNYFFHRAYNHVWKFINQVNAYFHQQEPWKLAKADPQRFKQVISATCHSLHAIALILWPVMPSKMVELLAALGSTMGHDVNMLEQLATEPWRKTFVLQQIPPLFAKFESQEVKPEEQEPSVSYISIEDFLKVELLVGTIEQVEIVPKSEKLYKLHVNFGEQGMRQICSGVRAHFKPEELLGKQGVVVFNLQPRMIMGLESQGMMLFAENGTGKLEMVTVGAPVANGTKLR